MSNVVGAKLIRFKNHEFPIVGDLDIEGGYRTVDSIAEMNAINECYRKAGMLVYVKGGKTYKLSDDLQTFSEHYLNIDDSVTYILDGGGA